MKPLDTAHATATAPGEGRDTVVALVEKAHQVRPCSHAVRGHVDGGLRVA